eukprot:scaffold2849_cov203-Alexandrium_tamarense.AAC.8
MKNDFANIFSEYNVTTEEYDSDLNDTEDEEEIPLLASPPPSENETITSSGKVCLKEGQYEFCAQQRDHRWRSDCVIAGGGNPQVRRNYFVFHVLCFTKISLANGGSDG